MSVKVETMTNATAKYQLTISRNEAKGGVKKILTRKGKRLEVTIPAGVKTGNLVKLSGALQTTDGYYGDILIQIKVKRRFHPGAIAGIAIICFFVVMYALPDSGTENAGYIYDNGAIECGGDGEPIVLVDNPDATNPTYAELVAFIVEDTTNLNYFVDGGPDGYVCADYAEDVHNNAEAAGIRAAWVGVNFKDNDEGHALNAFETTDKGLVYIDCVGWDTIAYVEEEREYGRIDIAQAESLSYSFYQEYIHKWQEFETRLEAYNKDVAEYNRETTGKVYIIGSTEEIRISAWEARLEEEEQELDRLSEELGKGQYEYVGIVEDIYIHWEGKG